MAKHSKVPAVISGTQRCLSSGRYGCSTTRWPHTLRLRIPGAQPHMLQTVLLPALACQIKQDHVLSLP